MDKYRKVRDVFLCVPSVAKAGLYHFAGFLFLCFNTKDVPVRISRDGIGGAMHSVISLPLPGVLS